MEIVYAGFANCKLELRAEGEASSDSGQQPFSQWVFDVFDKTSLKQNEQAIPADRNCV